jgi:hypothetical protein
MNRDVHEYYRTYDQCQITGNLLTHNLAKFVTILLLKTISKMGIRFHWTY